MGDIALRGPDVKKFVKLAKKRDLNFAYCPGNDPKEDVFVLDRKKKPEVIGRVARGEGTGTKAAIGTARVKGRVMTLTCMKEVPQAAKKLKKFLKFEKVPMNIIIMDMKGNIIEEDIEELPADPELDGDDFDEDDEEGQDAGNDGNDSDEAPRLEQLKERVAALQNAIGGLDQKAQGPMGKALKAVVAAMKAGQLETADVTLTKLEEAVAKMGGDAKSAPAQNSEQADDLSGLSAEADALAKRIEALGNDEGAARLLAAHGLLAKQIAAGDAQKATSTSKALGEAVARAEAQTTDDNASDDAQQQGGAADLEAAWRKAREELEPVARDLAHRGMGDVNKLNIVVTHLVEKGEAGAFANALKAVPGLKKLIADAQAATQTEAEQAIPAGVVHYYHARMDWRETRSNLTSEMTKLQKAIVDTCDENEFPDIGKETKQLFSYLDRLDGRLEDALEALEKEPDGAKRETLKDGATKLLEEYKSELETDFFKAVDTDNGFVSVNVRGAAIKSLGKVQDALTQAAA